MISEKYLAGFLDSDGSIQVLWRCTDKSNPTEFRSYLSLEFSQKLQQDKVLYLIKDTYGGNIYFRENHGNTYVSLKIFGKPAEMLLNRIIKYLVIKAAYAEAVLSILGQTLDKKETQLWLKEQRKKYTIPKQQYPTRKWLAGYIDGDGCFQVRVPKNREAGQVTFEISSSNYDRCGLELIQKNFGGSITTNDRISSFTLTMPPSKVNQLYTYCGEYLITKKEQLQFLDGCASMGHFRDGRRISAFLKQLKTHPHRLNEKPFDVAQFILQVVDVKRTTRQMKR